MLNDEQLVKKAKHFIEYARHSRVEDLDNVVKEFVNLIREQRIQSLKEVLNLLNNQEIHEAIIKERQRQETAEFPKGETL